MRLIKITMNIVIALVIPILSIPLLVFFMIRDWPASKPYVFGERIFWE